MLHLALRVGQVLALTNGALVDAPLALIQTQSTNDGVGLNASAGDS
jgi:hypothetical protein